MHEDKNNPYNSVIEDVAKDSPTRRVNPARRVLHLQILAAIICGVVGTNETRIPQLLARPLLWLSMLAFYFQLAGPLVLFMLSDLRRANLARLLIAFVASILLSIVSFLGMAPLFQ